MSLIPGVVRNVLYMPTERLANAVAQPGPWAAIVTASPTVHPSKESTESSLDLTVFPPNRDPFPISDVGPMIEELYVVDGLKQPEHTWRWPPRDA